MLEQSEQEIAEIIKKNLPAAVGEVLKKRLVQAEEDAEKVVTLNGTIKNKNEEISSLKNQIEEYKKCDDRNSKLEEREKEVSERENKMEIETLKYQLSSEKDKTAHSKEIMLSLTRNIEYRKSMLYSEHVPVHNPNTGYTETQYKSESKTEEKKAE